MNKPEAIELYSTRYVIGNGNSECGFCSFQDFMNILELCIVVSSFVFYKHIIQVSFLTLKVLNDVSKIDDFILYFFFKQQSEYKISYELL